MSKSKDTDYIFLSAYLRAKETKMLSRDALENLLTEGSFADAARSLTDCGYEDMSQMNSTEVEAELARYRNAELQDVAEAAAQKELVDLFRIPYDYHNAKVLIKTGGVPGASRRLLSSAGRVDPDELVHAVQEEDLSALPQTMADAMQGAHEVMSSSQNPQQADMILDRAYFSEMLAASEALGDPFIDGYVRLLIDSANLRSTVRALRMGRDAEFLRETLLPGGKVPTSEILEKVAGEESFAELFSDSGLAEVALLGEKAVKEEHLTAFELAADNAVTAYLAGSEWITFGPGPVLSYLFALENQTTALRMILTGRLLRIPPEIIRERLRDSNA